MEKRGTRVSRKKTEYLTPHAGTTGHTGGAGVSMQGEGAKRVVKFKYLGSWIRSMEENNRNHV